MEADASAGVPTWAWAVFGAAVVVALAADLLAHRRQDDYSRRSAAVWTAIWVGLGLAFLPFVWVTLGARAGQEYLAVYLIEKSLSLDNLFLFLVIFHSLGVEKRHHHRVLFWGILGAVAFRALFIFLGAAAVRTFGWVTYALGGVLVAAAWRTWREDPTEGSGESRIVEWLSERLPLSEHSHEGRFLAREDGERVVTATFAALVAIEASDVVFAIDSVAAALSITRAEFILYTANVFAVLGLRALYLLLEGVIEDFRYLHYGLASVLGFAGLKLLAHDWVEVPPMASVAVIVVLVGGSIVASVRESRGRSAAPEP